MAKEKIESADSKSDKKKSGGRQMWNRVKRWFREMRSELKKVVWPTKKQTLKNSLVAAVVTVVSGVVLWAFDQVAMLIVQTLISIGG